MSLCNLEEMARRLHPGQRLLALDVGARWLGLAISDPARRVATPLAVWERQRQQETARLADLVRNERVGGLVVGLPLRLDGSDSDSTARARAFAASLLADAQLGALPLLFQDERFSTEIVQRTARDHDQRQRRQQRDDAAAACIFLDTVLSGLRRWDGAEDALG